MPHVEVDGALVYRGVDSGTVAVRCDQGAQEPLLVLSAASVRPGTTPCSGELRINLRSGEAWTSNPTSTDPTRVPYFVELGLSDCATIPLSRKPPTSATDLGSASDSEAACWLFRVLGNQRARMTPAQPAIELALPAQVALAADLIVRRGTTLRLRPAATVRTAHITVGRHQIRVEAGVCPCALRDTGSESPVEWRCCCTGSRTLCS